MLNTVAAALSYVDPITSHYLAVGELHTASPAAAAAPVFSRWLWCTDASRKSLFQVNTA